jgi:uncharacterized lipoprotein YddW (UPF0748 family)
MRRKKGGMRFFPLVLAILLLSVSAGKVLAAEPTVEVRGAWIDRSSLVSREEIRTTLRQLADAHFNLALVNVWSRGYPLWKSQVFEEETGMATDPGFGGRDVLAEVVEEARLAGIAVMPWFEYGFIGGYSGYLPGQGGRGPIFDRHPEWLAMTRAQATGFPAPGGFFYWMSHTQPEVQEFLLRMITEVCRNYSIVGIQFDRARYPQLDCGYDSYTLQLYARENPGAAPPSDPAAPFWVRWRANKLNDFVAAIDQRVRAVGRHLLVSGAPIVYPFSYLQFAQEYPAWIARGALDFTVPQIYRRDAASFEAELQRQIAAAGRTQTLVAGIDSTNPTVDDLIMMVQKARAYGLPGTVIWYYRALLHKGALTRLRQTVFLAPARLPWAIGRPSPLPPRSASGNRRLTDQP